jgi:hypothetical protein
MATQFQEPTFFILKRRLPSPESIDILGRVVRQFRDPTFEYTPQSPAKSLTPEIFNQFLLSPQYDDSTHFTASASGDERLWGKLKGLFSLSFESVKGGSTIVTSPRITTRRLKQEIEYFKILKSVSEVRSKMLEMCSIGGKVYLIVGTLSIQTAMFKQTGKNHSIIKATGSLPLGAVASAAAASGGIPLPIGAVDAQLGAGRSTSSDWTMEFTATATGPEGDKDEGAEEVFAIACREITRDWHGLGTDVKMRVKGPEYRGGQHFGEGDQSDSDQEEDSEEAEITAAENLRLADSWFRAVESGTESAVFEFKSGFIDCS